MSEEREPIRLRDDPAEDHGLREMLDAARGESASDAMLDRVLAGVLASGGGGGGSGGGGAGAKIAAGIGAVAIGAGVIALVVSSSSSPSSSVPRVSVVVSVDAVAALDAWSAPDAGAFDVGIDAHVRLAHAPRPTPPPSSAAPTESDGALLMRATRDHDPSSSLTLALEHRARFPTSASSEDREALIVLDLARLDRASEAHAAADTFFARWPHSAARTNIETTLARMH